MRIAQVHLPRPSETNNVLRVRSQRDGFLAKRNALLVCGDEAPSLSNGDGVVVGKFDLSPELTLAKVETVAFDFVCGGRGAEEICLVISGDLPVIDLAFTHQQEPRIAHRQPKFVQSRV